MANIAAYLAAIMNAVYGEEVRGSIHDAIDAINTESIATKTTANNAMTTANAAAAVVGGYGGLEHRNHWRGRNLGSSVTNDQWTAIQNGSFNDLFIGDYWLINNVYWQIMDFDYWYNRGSNLQKHHAVIVPSGSLYNGVMNDTDTTDGGYYGSKMNTTGLSQALSMVNAAFGESHIIEHDDSYSSDIRDGIIAGNTAVTNAKIGLLDEIMMFGCRIKNMSRENKFNTYQLAGMRLRPYYPARATHWLRDVGNNRNFVVVGGDGTVYEYGASTSFGVRPVFAIGVNS